MRIYNKQTGETVATFITNHSMTLDEAIDLVGEHITPETEWDEDVEINGERYFSADLDIEA